MTPIVVSREDIVTSLLELLKPGIVPEPILECLSEMSASVAEQIQHLRAAVAGRGCRMVSSD